MRLDIYNLSGSVAETVKVGPDSFLNWDLMGSKEIRVIARVFNPINISIGCYIIHQGEQYTINTVPGCTKESNHSYLYEIIFESALYRLYDKRLKDESAFDFTYYGSALNHIQLLVNNINTVDSGWSIGFVDETTEKHISYEDLTCRAALNKIAEAFQLEWYLSGKQINLVKQAGNSTSHVFQYGRGKGLYSLSYKYHSEKNIVTRAYGYGSTRNLPQDYRNRAKRLSFDSGYLDQNVANYGIKEGSYINDDIYPHRTGEITSVGALTEGQLFSITDTSLDFNINDYLLEGVEAKIVFKSGELSGYEFVITSFNNTTKVITCKPIVEQSGYTMPNTVFSPAIGDTYTLVDISMPQSYIDAAELELKTKTLEYLQENSVPRVLYSLNMDRMHALRNNIILNPGDIVRVKDEGLNINVSMRISSVRYPITFFGSMVPSGDIEIEIANFIPYTITERTIASTIDNKKEIKVVERTNAERARRNAFNLRQLQSLMFDPDGYFDTGNIKPGSIETLMLAVGAKSQNFNLNNVTINPNAAGDENSLIISAGTLVHRELSIEGLGYTWQIEFETWAGLDPDKYYYVYARCSKTALVGTWQISETPIQAEQEAGFYNFNLGLLYAVNDDGYRDFEFTSGMTYIVGDNITTGRIKSLDGLNYFDLNTAQFNLGDSETGLDWNVTEPGRLTIRGFLIANQIIVGTGAYQNAGLSGASPNGANSIRFWAGATAEQKANAPFRVLDNGKVYANSVVLGYGGESTGWTVTPSGIISDPAITGGDNFALMRGSSHDKEFSFGTELIPSSGGGASSLTGRLKNKRAETDQFFPTTNTALQLEATGANNNYALDIVNGEIKVKGEKALNDTIGMKVQDGRTGGVERIYYMKFVNGMLISAVEA